MNSRTEQMDENRRNIVEDYPRRTCPGGFDYAGHVCDDSGCPPGYPRLTATGWVLYLPSRWQWWRHG